jgi:hypothetical protein
VIKIKLIERYIEWTHKHPKLMRNISWFDLILTSLIIVFLVWTDQTTAFWFWLWVASLVNWFITNVEYRNERGD